MAIRYRDKPCQACGWKFQGFHICLDLPQDVMERVEDGRKAPSVRSSTDSSEPPALKGRAATLTDGHRTAIANGVRNKHARDPKRVERNKEIIRLYQDEDFSMREIAEKLKVDQKTVMNVLHSARERGDVVIRRAARRTGVR